MFERVILIVLDGVGVGALPDASQYNDTGANTLVNALRAAKNYSLPFLSRAGLGLIIDEGLLPQEERPLASWGTMREASVGKDTIIGHWEMMGLKTEHPFPTFPGGFPADWVSCFEQAIERKTLGNLAISGTEILKLFGQEHMRSGRPIIYTSADSVLQIACHEEIVPLAELYRFCTIARSLLQGDLAVLRVIARPFQGSEGVFIRTGNRRDFTLSPPGLTVLDLLFQAGLKVVALGKIADVFSGRGITVAEHTPFNRETMDVTRKWLRSESRAFIFVNLGDFDTLWGHRRLPREFVRCLERADSFLEEIWEGLTPEDLLIVTADHGNDPTMTRHSDHTREEVPLMIFWRGKVGRPLGQRESFLDIGETIVTAFGLQETVGGKGLLPLLTGKQPIR